MKKSIKPAHRPRLSVRTINVNLNGPNVSVSSINWGTTRKNESSQKDPRISNVLSKIDLEQKLETSGQLASVTPIERTNISMKPDIFRKSCLMDSFTNSKELEVGQKYCRTSRSIVHNMKHAFNLEVESTPKQSQNITLSNICKLNSTQVQGKLQQSWAGSIIKAAGSISTHRSEYGAENSSLLPHKYFANLAKINLTSPTMSVLNKSIDLNVSYWFNV